MIESYSFGKMKIDGKTYNSDIMVFPGRIDATWWRKEGHNLHPEDLETALAEKPEMLVIGTGFFGLMKIDEKTKALLKEQNIEVQADKTGRAVEYFNRISAIKKTVGVFHITC